MVLIYFIEKLLEGKKRKLLGLIEIIYELNLIKIVVFEVERWFSN